MTTNICTPPQYAAIEEIVRAYSEPCPFNNPEDSPCEGCGGTGIVRPYTDLGAWLEAHGKEELYECAGVDDFRPVIHVADALDVLKEAGWRLVYESDARYGRHIWSATNLGVDTSWNKWLHEKTAAELLDKVLAEIELMSGYARV